VLVFSTATAYAKSRCAQILEGELATKQVRAKLSADGYRAFELQRGYEWINQLSENNYNEKRWLYSELLGYSAGDVQHLAQEGVKTFYVANKSKDVVAFLTFDSSKEEIAVKHFGIVNDDPKATGLFRDLVQVMKKTADGKPIYFLLSDNFHQGSLEDGQKILHSLGFTSCFEKTVGFGFAGGFSGTICTDDK